MACRTCFTCRARARAREATICTSFSHSAAIRTSIRSMCRTGFSSQCATADRSAAEGLTIRTATSNFVLAVNLYSPDNKYDQIFISNYAYMHLQQLIARIPGVGTPIFSGSDNMRCGYGSIRYA